MRGRRSAWLGRLLALGLVTGCASGGGTGTAQRQQAGDIPTAIITVLNNAPRPREITVYISSGSFSEDRADAQRAGLDWDEQLGIRLGSIDPNQTGRFPFDFGRTSGRFRLIAVDAALANKRPLESSDGFELYRYSQAIWNLSIRSVEVRGR